MEPLAVDVEGTHAIARTLEAADLDALVAYWHDSPPTYLVSLGVDLAKLGSRSDTRARLASTMDPGARALTVVAELDGELVAYTNLRVVSEDTACGHLHTLRNDPLVRRIVYLLFPQVTGRALAALNVSCLRFEASVGNRGINRYLQSFGLRPRQIRLQDPDGFARAGDFNVYELTATPAHEEAP